TGIPPLDDVHTAAAGVDVPRARRVRRVLHRRSSTRGLRADPRLVYARKRMRFGLVTPVVTRHPQNDPPWTDDAGPDDSAPIPRAADRLGFHHLTCSEHVAVPAAVVPVRGARYYDPLATFGFLAAQTTRIRFVTHVLVLGYHHPLAIAKRYGTLDRLAGGRLVLGVGVGTLAEEFALLGAP